MAATDALSGRRKRRAASQVARARREKMALVAGVLILGVLLAVEGPKTLRGLESASPTSPSPSTTSTPAPSQAPSTSAAAGSLKTVDRYKAKDPFVPQLGVNGTPTPGPTAAKPPRVRTTHFVPKNPFRPQLGLPTSSAPGPTPAVPPKVSAPRAVTPTVAAPKPGKARPLTSLGKGVVVIVASIPVGQGQAAADKAAARAKARGVRGVHVALSSASKSLRSGFYAVYAGPYPTLAQATTALTSIRGAGYSSAYTRVLGH